jgi:hypothetical protein
MLQLSVMRCYRLRRGRRREPGGAPSPSHAQRWVRRRRRPSHVCLSYRIKRCCARTLAPLCNTPGGVNRDAILERAGAALRASRSAARVRESHDRTVPWRTAAATAQLRAKSGSLAVPHASDTNGCTPDDVRWSTGRTSEASIVRCPCREGARRAVVHVLPSNGAASPHGACTTVVDRKRIRSAHQRRRQGQVSPGRGMTKAKARRGRGTGRGRLEQFDHRSW